MSRIAVIGAGSWGTALAISLARRGAHEVRLWSRSAEAAASIERLRENIAYLPGHHLAPHIRSTASLEDAAAGASLVICAVPAQHQRDVFRALAPHLEPSQAIISAAKGIEATTALRMTEVISQVWGEVASTPLRVGVLSGPSFAKEVAEGLPTAITAASTDRPLAKTVQEEFSAPALRIYTNDDVIGVELGGALKNVIAIAAGIVTGLELGHNSMAALLTRGIAEITRLAVACGGRAETLAGLSGLGDLVLTATGPLSRNRYVGVELGHGRKLPEILQSLEGKVAEGVHTASAALKLAHMHGVEMPIAEQMSAILHEGKPPRAAMHDLMTRPGRGE